MWPGEQQPEGQQRPEGNPQSDPQSNPQWNPQGPPPPPPGGAQPPYGAPVQGPPPQGPAPYGQPPQGFGPPPQPGYGQPPQGPPAQGQPPQAQPGFGPTYGYPQQQPQPGYGGGYGQQPQWGAPSGPPTTPLKPPGGNRGRTAAIAVTAAVAVIAAGVGAVFLLGGGHKKAEAKAPASASASAPAAANPADPQPSDPDDAGPRGSGTDVKPVVPGWQVVANGDRKVAFDVPPGWQIPSEDTVIGFEDEKGNPAVRADSPAQYKNGWCGDQDNSLAGTGTNGISGAKSVSGAAQDMAAQWVYYAFADLKAKDKGKLAYSAAKPFSNSHGIKGYVATATETSVPKSNKCATDGTAYDITWLGSDNQLDEWVLWTSTGVSGTVPPQTVQTIEQSLRTIP
ncbi:hypothetical protein ABZ832_12285 [Streptantibioticus parmotrematis]|uniref:hypothetical protein n=1 Tax=Streptantibioticus parmotrematis TaxID=2873249 RepID=UPI0033FC33DF